MKDATKNIKFEKKRQTQSPMLTLGHGTMPAPEVFRKHRLSLYGRYVPNPNQPYLDMTQFERNRAHFPVALLPCPKPEIQKLDSFYVDGNRYMAFQSVEQLYQVMCECKPDHNLFSAMVIPDRPCQMYFDLDCARADHPQPHLLDDVSNVMTAFWSFVSDAFEQTFHRRIRGLKKKRAEFDASDKRKFSRHLHLPTEAFGDLNEHRAFIKGPFFQLIQKAAAAEEPRAKFVGFWSAQKPKTNSTLYPHLPDKGGYFHIIADLGVYTKYRVFRFPECKKPGGPRLVLDVGPEELRGNVLEQLRCAMISFAHPGDDKTYTLLCMPKDAVLPPQQPKLSFALVPDRVRRIQSVNLRTLTSAPLSPKLNFYHVGSSRRYTDGLDTKTNVAATDRLIEDMSDEQKWNCAQESLELVNYLLSSSFTMNSWVDYECTPWQFQGYLRRLPRKPFICPFHSNEPNCLLRIQILSTESTLRVACKNHPEEGRLVMPSAQCDELFPSRNAGGANWTEAEFFHMFAIV